MDKSPKSLFKDGHVLWKKVNVRREGMGRVKKVSFSMAENCRASQSQFHYGLKISVSFSMI
jgi:hypothetical protein